jgi:DNA-binding Lrp family transcriptional regulator
VYNPRDRKPGDAVQPRHQIDELDVRILELLRSEPRIGVLELSRRLGVARGTAQARIDKMTRDGLIVGFGPDLDLSALGFVVTAFVTIEVVQGRLSDVVEPLSDIPEVTEVHTIAGRGDMVIKVEARSNEHLMAVLERILAIDDVARTSTAIALANPLPERSMPLVRSAAAVRE